MPMPGNHNDIEKKLWDAADQLRANSRLKSSEYSTPVLGLIFLRYADYKFQNAQKEFEGSGQIGSRRRTISKADYHAKGVLYVPEQARFSYLLKLPEGNRSSASCNRRVRSCNGGPRSASAIARVSAPNPTVLPFGLLRAESYRLL